MRSWPLLTLCRMEAQPPLDGPTATSGCGLLSRLIVAWGAALTGEVAAADALCCDGSGRTQTSCLGGSARGTAPVVPMVSALQAIAAAARGGVQVQQGSICCSSGFPEDSDWAARILCTAMCCFLLLGGVLAINALCGRGRATRQGCQAHLRVSPTAPVWVGPAPLPLQHLTCSTFDTQCPAIHAHVCALKAVALTAQSRQKVVLLTAGAWF
jgi:hypothetical protein